VPTSPSSESIAAWSDEVSRLIRACVRYPDAALEDELEGTTIVLVTITADGRVSAPAIARSSGEPVLDRAARDQVGALGAVPPPPGGEARQVRVPIRFTLP